MADPDQEMEDPTSDQQRTPAARGRRGRRGSRGRGGGRGHGRGREEEEQDQGQGRIREERRRREEGRNRGQIIAVPRREDRAIREVEDGVWKAKCFNTRREADWQFETKVAACVAFDVSHIIAMEKGWAKAPRKGGIFFHTASPALLHDLVDVDRVVTGAENRLLRTATHMGRLVDEFLASLSAEKQDPASATFPAIPNGTNNETNMVVDYDYNIEHCCFHPEPRGQRPLRDVPGLDAILAAHRGNDPLMDNPTGADFGYLALLRGPEETLPKEEPRRGRPPRHQPKTPLLRQDGTSLGKKKHKQNDGGGGGGPPPPLSLPLPLPLPPEVQEGPYLVLEVETSCPQHGERVPKHYHFAHDCVCEAKRQMRDCFEYINLDPTFRSYLNDFELPKCFRDWKYRLHTQPEPEPG